MVGSVRVVLYFLLFIIFLIGVDASVYALGILVFMVGLDIYSSRRIKSGAKPLTPRWLRQSLAVILILATCLFAGFVTASVSLISICLVEFSCSDQASNLLFTAPMLFSGLLGVFLSYKYLKTHKVGTRT